MVLYQSAQRRALYQLTELGVPWGGGTGAPLRFSYRSRHGGRGGASSAMPAVRSRSTSTRPTRPGASRSAPGSASATARRSATSATSSATTCGWSLVAPDPAHLEEFRTVFGDERKNYAAAFAAHYDRIDDGSWRDDHASFYASAHPWEDFAESWAQVMHVHDVVETGAAWGVGRAARRPGRRRWRGWRRRRPPRWPPTSWPAPWAPRDPYPFTLSRGDRAKSCSDWSA